MTPAESAFLAEMNRRENLPPIHATRFGTVRVNPSPCDPRGFVVTGPAIYILQMEAKGHWFGARYRTLATAVKHLDRITRKMERAERACTP